MFAENFQRYVYVEHARRRRDDRVSLFASLIVVAVMLAFGFETRSAALVGLAFLLVCTTFSTVRFCLGYGAAAKVSRRNASRSLGVLYRPVSRRAAMIAIPIAALAVAILKAPEVGARILDRRIRRLAGPAALDKNARAQVGDAFHEAARFKLRLSPDVAKIGTKLASNSTVNIPPPPDMQGKPFAASSEANGSAWSFWPIASNTGPDNYSTIGVAAFPDCAEMWHANGTPPPTLYGPAYLVVKGLNATLDGFLLKHVVFQDMSLTFHGGPLILDEVYFINCNFQFDPTTESWALISSLLKGGWVEFRDTSSV